MSDALDAIFWPVRTQRLTIRRAVAGDVEAMWRYRRLEEVSRWLTSASTDPVTSHARLSEPGRLATTLIAELDGVVIGDLMLAIEDAWAQTEVVDRARGVQAELGWCLDPAFHGRGYATEAVAELIRIGFAELGLRRVTALCFADNTASWRLMERLGMRRESHTVRDSLHRSGEWLDGLGYALLAGEWTTRAPSPRRSRS